MYPKHIIRRHALSQLNLKDTHPLLCRIYSSRKIQSADELDQTLGKLLPYHELLHVERAAELIAHAILLQQRILIVGDFDADGATSSAVAVRALKSFGAKHISFLVPNRFAFGYGLTPELVNKAEEMQPDLIITVDNGIANHAGVARARELNIAVIITDHHLTGSTLPDANVIVNPNQPGDQFKSKNLAGVGVIFYVMLALRRRLVELDWFSKMQLALPNMALLLDLVALGTVADLVPLDHNNRILVHHGIKRIRTGLCSPGIIALLELANRDFERTVSADLSFAVAARLNAAGRLDDMSLGIECLISDDSLKVREIARTLNQLNDERKYIEKEMQMQALDALQNVMQPLNSQLPKGLCLFDSTWHQGVIGILASRIKDRFNRPVIIFAPGQPGELKGSARSIPHLHIRDILVRIDALYPALIKKFGGHAMAAGLSIADNKFEFFQKVFNQMVTEQVSDADLEHTLLSDGQLSNEELSLEIAHLIRDSGPWGQAFPEPLFDDVFTIVEQHLVADKHLKLKLCKENKIIDAMAFFIDTAHWPNHRCKNLRVAYRLDVNEYKNQTRLQLILDYLEPV